MKQTAKVGDLVRAQSDAQFAESLTGIVTEVMYAKINAYTPTVTVYRVNDGDRSVIANQKRVYVIVAGAMMPDDAAAKVGISEAIEAALSIDDDADAGDPFAEEISLLPPLRTPEQVTADFAAKWDAMTPEERKTSEEAARYQEYLDEPRDVDSYPEWRAERAAERAYQESLGAEYDAVLAGMSDYDRRRENGEMPEEPIY